MKDAVRYTVKVIATIERQGKTARTWAKVGTRHNEQNPDKPLEHWDYTSEVDSTVRGDVEIYTQTVDDIDMAKLVAVVNKLP